MVDAGNWNGYIQQYINEAKKDLENLKKIIEPERLCLESGSIHSKHSTRLSTMSSSYYNEKLGEKGASGSELLRYNTLVNELRELYQKTLENWNKTQEQQKRKQKQNQIKEEIRQKEARKSHCSQCGKKSLVYHYIYNKNTNKLEQSYSNATDSNNEWVFCTEGHFKIWWQNNYFQCAECGKQYIGEGWIYCREKNDGKKFCEDNDKICFFNHYAETCDKCFQKCLKYENSNPITFESYYSDNKNKTGNLCFNCNERRIQKEKERLKEELTKIAEQEVARKRELAEIERKLSEDERKKKEQEKKKKYCFGCSAKLTENEVAYCFACKKKNEDVLKELEKGLKVENDDFEREQNRTEQNRPEQNRTEQNRT
jgi:hypothetical protein